MTTYVVLGATGENYGGDDHPLFVVLGRATAANDVAAIKAVAKERGEPMEHGAVAVPARSWRPRKPERKVEERTLWT